MANEDFVSAKAIRAALRSGHKPSGTTENLLTSLILVQDEQAGMIGQPDNPITRLATNELLLKAITFLRQQKPIYAQILHKRFIEGVSALGIATQLTYTEDTVYRNQREAIQALTRIINEWETTRREEKAIELEADLEPASYNCLFGIDAAQAELQQHLLNPTEHWLISIVGLGGIGKTALADATARRIIRSFYFKRVVWVRMEAGDENGRFLSPEHAYANLLLKLDQAFWAEEETQPSRQQQQQRVRLKLTQQPYLVVVDNLENLEHTAYLAQQLSGMTNPSKILITSRVHPQSHIPIYLTKINEISAPDAFAFIRHHAQEKGMQFIHQTSDSDLQAIYDTVGGNPYALKLVVSLLDLWPLPALLDSLAQGTSGSNPDLYTHIYKQIWLSLSDNAKLLLQALTLTAEIGGTAAQLQRAANLQADFWAALQELHQRSLVEVRGTLQEKRYGLHRLTYTFLCTEITGWDDDLG